MLADNVDPESPLGSAVAPLIGHAESSSAAFARLRALAEAGRLGRSLPARGELVHMRLNRLFQWNNRMLELVICDCLAQLYSRRLARAAHHTGRP